MQFIAPATLFALLSSFLPIPTLGLPTLLPLGTTGTDLNALVLNDLNSDSLLHHYAPNLDVPTTKFSRSDQQDGGCAPISFKNGHKICDPKCDRENCNNLPVREMGEDEVEVEDSGEGEVNSVGVKGGKDGHKGRAQNDGVKFGHWYMNSPPIEKREHAQGEATGSAA